MARGQLVCDALRAAILKRKALEGHILFICKRLCFHHELVQHCFPAAFRVPLPGAGSKHEALLRWIWTSQGKGLTDGGLELGAPMYQAYNGYIAASDLSRLPGDALLVDLLHLQRSDLNRPA